MTRLSALHLAIACLLIGAIAGSEIAAWPSGIDAPELSERPVVPFVNGRPVIVPDWSAVLPYGAWGGCWDCPTHPGVIDDEAPSVPLPGAVWSAATSIAALAALKWRTTWMIVLSAKSLRTFRRRARP